MSWDDVDPDDFDDEDDYEDAVEELEREEQEYEERRSRGRGGLRSLWGDLTGARIFPGGFPNQPEVSWPAPNVDAWRAGSTPALDATLDTSFSGAGLDAGFGGDPFGDSLSAVADVDAWRAKDEPRQDEPPAWP